METLPKVETNTEESRDGGGKIQIGDMLQTVDLDRSTLIGTSSKLLFFSHSGNHYSEFFSYFLVLHSSFFSIHASLNDKLFSFTCSKLTCVKFGGHIFCNLLLLLIFIFLRIIDVVFKYSS